MGCGEYLFCRSDIKSDEICKLDTVQAGRMVGREAIKNHRDASALSGRSSLSSKLESDESFGRRAGALDYTLGKGEASIRHLSETTKISKTDNVASGHKSVMERPLCECTASLHVEVYRYWPCGRKYQLIC